jgi:hypothetical protein
MCKKCKSVRSDETRHESKKRREKQVREGVIYVGTHEEREKNSNASQALETSDVRVREVKRNKRERGRKGHRLGRPTLPFIPLFLFQILSCQFTLKLYVKSLGRLNLTHFLLT